MDLALFAIVMIAVAGEPYFGESLGFLCKMMKEGCRLNGVIMYMDK
jgi:hypothetical protein